MANIMTMKKLQNKTSRNGFDLSRMNRFTAKVGELLPCACIECIPGDSFNIKTKHMTRTMPLNSAAFTRIREYYDWFFVPTNLLWNKFNTFVTQMGNNNQQAVSITESSIVSDEHPYFTSSQIGDYIQGVAQSEVANNAVGFSRADNSLKLLEYLDYGTWYRTNGDSSFLSGTHKLNPFPLLAYQKIYSDYYRNSQWEDSFAPAFNINYINGNNVAMTVPSSQEQILASPYTMFDLHYANWHKDYFMGLLPNSQYGDIASVNIGSAELPNATTAQLEMLVQTEAGHSFTDNNNLDYKVGLSPDFIYNKDNQTIAQGLRAQYGQTRTNQLYQYLSSSMVKKLRDAMGIDASSLSGAFSILALRNAEAMQKWAEITQSQQQDYQSQVDAHFGVKVSDAYSERCTWIGGGDSTIDVSEVMNNNLDSNLSVASIRGKGVGTSDDFCKFETKVHGYLMCIYHAVPLIDYGLNGIPRRNLKTKVTDYAIPEFDKTGMVSVPTTEFYIPSVGRPSPEFDLPELMGYAPRYYDYKTSFDTVKGAFLHGGLQQWVAPITPEYLLSQGFTESGDIDYNFFKVNPSFMNPIFANPAGDKVDSDQLLVNTYFDIKSVRNLDRDGLPY